MGLVTHTFNERVSISASHASATHTGAKDIIENSIIPILEQYKNVTYLGKYEKSYSTKYVIDIGYDNIALCIFLTNTNISMGICLKSAVSDLTVLTCHTEGGALGDKAGYLVTSEKDSNSSTYYAIIRGVIRVIEHDNELKVLYPLCKDGVDTYCKIVLDEDNFQKKYIAISEYVDDTQSLVLYYDVVNPLKGVVNPLDVMNTLDMTALISDSLLAIDDCFVGVGSNFKIIRNASIELPRTLIDVQGVRYRNVYQYYWYTED